MTADDSRNPLDVAALRSAVIGSSPTWRRIDVVAETGSTNADLIARAAAADIDGAVLIAEHQTAGRGRQGRGWSDVPGAQIAMSVGVAALSVPSDGWGWLPLATGVAVVDAIREVTGIETGLKWPNDVLAEGGKLAGILAEVATPRRTIVVGLGLNVTLHRDEVSIPDAISLLDLGVNALDRANIIIAILHNLNKRIVDWRTAGGADAHLVADYQSRCRTIGVPVRAVLPGNREITGVATAVDGQGRLCIDSNREKTVVAAGDVVHLRAIP
jgi:BirA family biotin operon repressor/biotin-[acetyl-CoA-carboxylase] ligase